MSSPLSKTSGALSTDSTVRTGHGVLCYAEAGQVIASIYDGVSSTGTLIANISTGDRVSFHTPLQFGTGLFVSVASTTGIAVVHTG